jgi:hypothetical protein
VQIIVLFIVLISLNGWSKDCILRTKPFEGELQSLSRSIESGSTKAIECVEQEFVDMVLDPIRLQDFAMKQCEAKPECKVALVKEAARVSKLEESRFEKLNAVALWGEIQRFSGANRIATIQFSDLPLTNDPEILFEKIRNERLAARTLNKSENLSMACTALAAIIGPAKLKALKLGKSRVLAQAPVKADEAAARFMADFPIVNPIKVNIFKKFDQSKNSAFKDRLAQFRGNDNIDFDPAMHGREGQIFTAAQRPGLAIKRFFSSNEIDPWVGVRMLEEAHTAVQAQPKISRLLSVVKVVERGPDYIVREFDAKSVPLKSIMEREEVTKAIIELKRELRFSTDSNLKKIYKKLDHEKPSENLHWSPEQKKILLIDITFNLNGNFRSLV